MSLTPVVPEFAGTVKSTHEYVPFIFTDVKVTSSPIINVVKRTKVKLKNHSRYKLTSNLNRNNVFYKHLYTKHF